MSAKTRHIIDHATGLPAAPIIDSSTGEPITCKCCHRVFTTHAQMASEYAGNDYWHLICKHRTACYARAKQTLSLRCSHCLIPIATHSHLDRWKWSAGLWEHHCVMLGIDPGYWPAEAIPQTLDDRAASEYDYETARDYLYNPDDTIRQDDREYRTQTGIYAPDFMVATFTTPEAKPRRCLVCGTTCPDRCECWKCAGAFCDAHYDTHFASCDTAVTVTSTQEAHS